MKVLSIETSTLAGGVALMDEKRLIAEYRLDVVVHHSERILSAIDLLLKESGTRVADLDAIAVSVGPGSFTGLRVGLATAKGLAIGQNKPLVLVPTLEAFASIFRYSESWIVPFIDARKSEVYWSLFKAQYGRINRLSHDAASKTEVALREISLLLSAEQQAHQSVMFVGDGVSRYRELIMKEMPHVARFPSAVFQFPSAATVAELGLIKLKKGEISDPVLSVPRYVRASTPELKRLAAARKIKVEKTQ